MQPSKMALFAGLSGLLLSCGASESGDGRASGNDAAAGSGGSAGVGGNGGGGASDAAIESDATDGANPTPDVITTDAPIVMGTCTIGGGECPAGYDCGCGGPGPGLCECHKKCGSANDCGASNPMCGCSAGDANKICVSACFCTCL